MNKEQFFKELRSRINILDEAEQQDILAEYAQHVDLRMSSGLSEEEAIRDFGDINELASGILEAYHVRPPKAPAISLPPVDLRRFFAVIGSFFCRLWGGVKGFFRSVFSAIGRAFHFIGSLFCREPKAPRVPSAPRVKGRFSYWTRRFFAGCLRLFKVLWRLFIDLLLLMVILPLGLLAAAAIITLAFVCALLVQGYPLLGVLLICLGSSLCLGVLLICAVRCFVQRRRCRAQMKGAETCA